VDGTITLYGKVKGDAERSAAERAARRIDGVRAVRDLLQVVPESQRTAVKQSDQQVKQRAETALKGDRSLDDSHIVVKSVDRGVVLLAGQAANMTDALRAIEAVRGLAGVERVANEMTTPDHLADARIWRYGEPGEPGAREQGVAHDTWITVATKMKLMGDGEVPSNDVSVDTQAGVVTLFGMVPDARAKSAAEADARKVAGVLGVRNELAVVPSGEKKRVEARDDELKQKLKAAFEEYRDLKDIGFEVKAGVVHLTGSVPSGWERLHAATIARSLSGVRAVKDDLRVERPRG
jgi:hyperosmotically inducible protein